MVGIDPTEHLRAMLDGERDRVNALLDYLDVVEELLRLSLNWMREADPKSAALKIIEKKYGELCQQPKPASKSN